MKSVELETIRRALRFRVTQQLDVVADAGRTADPEHFGVSIGYSRGPMPEAVRASLSARSRGRDLETLFPQSLPALRALVEGLLEAGMSKFVLRPSGPVADWSDELGLLADTVNDLVN